MSMSKQDFEAIAHTLDANVADLSLVLDMADTLAGSNPRFDRVRFIHASTRNLADQHAHDVLALARATGKV